MPVTIMIAYGVSISQLALSLDAISAIKNNLHVKVFNSPGNHHQT